MATEMQLFTVASLLRRGRALDQLSNALSLVALLIGLAPLLGITAQPLTALFCALLLILGLGQKYWALRVAFDAELFHCVANLEQPLDQRGESLDQALIALGLQSAARGGRPWSERIRGALNLLRRQALLMALQVLVVVGLILAGFY